MNFNGKALATYLHHPCKLELGISSLPGPLKIYLKRLKWNSRKEKTVWFTIREIGSLLELIRAAGTSPPNYSVRVPVGTIHCQMGDIYGEIGPYWFGRDSAIFLRQRPQGRRRATKAVAIEHDHASKVCDWLESQLSIVLSILLKRV